MPEKLRINGYDFYNLSRQDDINNPKLYKGIYANTLDESVKSTGKLYTAVKENVYELQKMLENAQISVIEGIDTTRYMITGYRFKHSIGDIDFVDIDTRTFRNYGIKSDAQNLTDYIVDEDFSTAHGFPNSGKFITVSSLGGSLQDVPIVWTNITKSLYVGTSSTKLYDSQSLYVENTAVCTLQNTRAYSHYEMEFFVKHTSTSGVGTFFISYSGYTASVDVFQAFRIVFGNPTIEISDSTGTYSHTFDIPEGLNIAPNVWLKIRIRLENQTASLFINKFYIGNFTFKNLVHGDIGFYCNYAGLYINRFRMRRIPRKLSSVPNGDIMYDQDVFQFSLQKPSLVDLNFNKNLLYLQNVNIKGVHTTGYLSDAVSGDITVTETHVNLDEFTVNLRFKQNVLPSETQVIAQNGHDWTVLNYVKPDKLLAWYKFNKDFKDYSGNGNNVSGSGAFVDGKYGYGYYSSSYDEVIKLDFLQNIKAYESFSIAMWVSFKELKNSIFFGIGDASSSRFYGAVYLYNSKYYISFGFGDYSFVSTYTSSVIEAELDKFYHIYVEYSNGYFKAYINGQLASNYYYYADINLSTYTPMLGGYDVNYMKTVFDDVRIYDRALDENEIRQLYNSNEALKLNRLAFESNGELLIGDVIESGKWVEAWLINDGKSLYIFRRDKQCINYEARKALGELLVYVPFDSDLNNYAVNSPSTSVVGSITYDDKINKCGVFTGQVDNHVDTNVYNVLNYVNKTKRSFSAWVQYSSAMDISAKDGTTLIVGSSTYGGSFGLVLSSSGGLGFATRDNSNAITSLNKFISADTWVHLVGVLDYNKMFFYINGELFGTTPINGTDTLDYYQFRIGGGNIFSGGIITKYFEGKLDEVRIYAKALTSEEVKYLYNKKTYTKYIEIKDVVIDAFTLKETSKIPTIYDNTLYQVRAWEYSKDKLLVNSFLADGEDAFCQAEGLTRIYPSSVNTTNWTDSTYTGKLSNSIHVKDANWFLGDSPIADLFTQDKIYEFTLSNWFYIKDVFTAHGMSYLYYTNYVTGEYTPIFVVLNYISFNSIYIKFGNGSTEVTESFYVDNIPLNQWAKFDLTFKNGVFMCYINGEQKAIMRPLNFKTNVGDYIKVHPTNQLYFDMWSADFNISTNKIYERCLTSEEIHDMYVADPLYPYQQKLILNKTQFPSDDIFVENGLFGIEISNQRMKFKIFDKVWHNVSYFGLHPDYTTVTNYEMREITPLLQIIRVWFKADEGNFYQADVILEAGKYGCTIIANNSDYYDMFKPALVFDGINFSKAIVGLNDVRLADVNASSSTTDPIVNNSIAFRNNLVIGMSTNRIGTGYVKRDTNYQMLEYIYNNNITDENVVISVFGNSYSLTTFVEGENLPGAVAVTDSSSSGGKYAKVTTSLYSSALTLELGTYVVALRVKSSSTYDATNIFEVIRDSTVIEVDGYNKSSSIYTALTNAWTIITILFTVTDATAQYKIKVQYDGTSELHWDYYVLLPLANGKNYISDINEQNYSINNNKYIGLL